MKHAYVFPGQGAQFSGMGKTIYDSNEAARILLEEANDILGFRITNTMFTGSDEELKKTNITQPAVFIHSVAVYKSLANAQPNMVAGHSLGEFSALVANKTLAFADALKLVSIRAAAMQKACELTASTMAAVLNLPDENIVQRPSSSVHADQHLALQEDGRKGHSRKLRALVAVENLRLTKGEGQLQRIQAKARLQRVGQLPTQDKPAVPIHDGHQVHEAARQGEVSDVGTPNMIVVPDRFMP